MPKHLNNNDIKNLKTYFPITILSIVTTLLISCGGGGSGGGSSTSTSTTISSITANTTESGSVTNPYGNGGTCPRLNMTTTSCEAARTALGLTGNWLKFSCDVTLGLADSSLNPTTEYSDATYVSVIFYDIPDYQSNYFATTGSYGFIANGTTFGGTFLSMYTPYSTAYPDPSTIIQQDVTMYIPLNPSTGSPTEMSVGMVGVTINGVGIFDGIADGTDNIFEEALSFDPCQAHPADGMYHYHIEPFSISYKDSNLIGVMRDGYFVYGRYAYGGSTDLDTSDPSSIAYIYGGAIEVNPATGTGPAIFSYRVTQESGCIHRNESGIPYSDDGSPTCSVTTPSTGTFVSAYFLTGKGNGGIFQSIPSTTANGIDIIESVPAIKWYYGTPGTCTGCTG